MSLVMTLTLKVCEAADVWLGVGEVVVDARRVARGLAVVEELRCINAAGVRLAEESVTTLTRTSVTFVPSQS